MNNRYVIGAIAVFGIATAHAAPKPLPVPTGTGIRIGTTGPLIRFGTSKAVALKSLAAAIGTPVFQRTIPDCGQGEPMGEASFRDGLILAFMHGKFVGWDLTKGGVPAIHTDRGIGLGDTRKVLNRAYPDMTVDDGSLGVMFTSDEENSVSGFLSSDQPGGRVIGLFAGETCKIS